MSFNHVSEAEHVH